MDALFKKSQWMYSNLVRAILFLYLSFFTKRYDWRLYSFGFFYHPVVNNTYELNFSSASTLLQLLTYEISNIAVNDQMSIPFQL